ncbi:unnamed protein product (macronuclear) [Paramecium tetraurelia]|uniref:Uncharacterized protein n=1 Tax=Paramecium tetraurelia TaxID=5888 RepID=A0DNK6_PARTE|nr:uncharacterized protein GSPATT00018819001 [Paramecium tetraurelia]CAK84623.1 unnamed protein product [Paramecium tetraurelia]|eukprot:XP_001452020.1 hypothetical protein (macronuclear) [Paramecium tetraurelia strain d4-2]
MIQSFKIARKLQINIDSSQQNDELTPTFQSERNLLISTPSLLQKLKLKPIQEFSITTQTNNHIQMKSSIKTNPSFQLKDSIFQMKQICSSQKQKRVSFCDKVLIIETQKGVIKRERISTKDQQQIFSRTPKRKNCILIPSQHRILKTFQSIVIDQL